MFPKATLRETLKLVVIFDSEEEKSGVMIPRTLSQRIRIREEAGSESEFYT